MSGADNTASARPAQEQNAPDFHRFGLRAVGAPEAYAGETAKSGSEGRS
jgi:hypothetical protein